MLEDRAQAYRTIREEYSKKLAELTATNKKAFESMQKKRDEMAEQMRVYQAEIQEKRLQEVEAKRLKLAVANMEERIGRLTKQIEDLQSTNEVWTVNYQEMAIAREKAVAMANQELESLIDCVTGVTRMVQKGEKVSPVYLRDKVKDDTLKKMKAFLDLNKVKL